VTLSLDLVLWLSMGIYEADIFFVVDIVELLIDVVVVVFEFVFVVI